jgi:hypothetical protein
MVNFMLYNYNGIGLNVRINDIHAHAILLLGSERAPNTVAAWETGPTG